MDDEYDIYHNENKGTVKLGTFYADNGRVWGTILNDLEGMIMLTIPDQDGWEVYVDGVRSETINADYGFIAVYLDAGEHEIEAVYHIPYLGVGAAVSIAGVLGLIFLLLFIRHKECKRIEDISNE